VKEMTQQVLNREYVGRSGLSEQKSGLIRLAVALLVLMAVLLTANRLKIEPATSLPQVSEPVFSTQVYWDMAKAHADKAMAAPVNSMADAPAFYTEKYWEMAKKSAASPTAGNAQEFAFYTQRYWDMAKTHAEKAAAPINSTIEGPAFFTEPYWEMAKAQSEKATTPADANWAYYTERYWDAAQD